MGSFAKTRASDCSDINSKQYFRLYDSNIIKYFYITNEVLCIKIPGFEKSALGALNGKISLRD